MNNNRENVYKSLIKNHNDRLDLLKRFEDKYHNQTNYIFIYFSSIIALMTYITSSSLDEIFMGFEEGSEELPIFLLLLFTIFLMYYLISILLNDLYMIYMNWAGLKKIDAQINEFLGTEIYFWDSKFIPKDYEIKRIGRGIWIKPTYLVGMWIFIICSINSIILGFVCNAFSESYLIAYIFVSIFGLVFHATQWVVLHTIGIKYLDESIKSI